MANEYGSAGYPSDEQATLGSQSGRIDGTTGEQSPQYGADESDFGTGTRKAQGFIMPAVAADNVAATAATLRGEGAVVSEESVGEPPLTTIETISGAEMVGMHEAVANFSGEAGEEFAEASPEQLAEGMEQVESDMAFETAPPSVGSIAPEAGSGVEGWTESGRQQEFLPILAALLPTLMSTVGPMVAKKVVGRLSPRAQRGVKRLAASAPQLGKIAPSGVARTLALLAQLLQTKSATESGQIGEAASPEVESLVQETAMAMEVIIGNDDRLQITATTRDPWRKICLLQITFPSGAQYRGTGFLIGPRAVVTAGHCVYLHGEGGWARSIEVIPGANGSARPYGATKSSSLRSVKGWVTRKEPECDYGCIVLPSGAFSGHDLGYFGFASFQDPSTILAKPAVLAGFPGDKPLEMWGMQRRVKTVTSKTLIYDIDTVGGQSGAPVYIKLNGKRYVIGIHNYGDVKGNSATRITRDVADRLQEWSKL